MRWSPTGRFDVHYLTHFVDGRERSRNYRVSRIGDGGPSRAWDISWRRERLYATLRELDPAVIYQRVACGYTGICAAFSRRRSVPLIWHAAHDTEVTAQVLDPGAQFRARCGWNTGRSNSASGMRRASWCRPAIKRSCCRRTMAEPADAVIANFHPPPAETIDKRGTPDGALDCESQALETSRGVRSIWLAALRDQPEVRFIMVGAPAADVRQKSALAGRPDAQHRGHAQPRVRGPRRATRR